MTNVKCKICGYDAKENFCIACSLETGETKALLIDKILRENVSFRKEIRELELKNTSLEQQLIDVLSKKILLVEDGSVDCDNLDERGIPYIVYRQGSNPPMFIKERD